MTAYIEEDPDRPGWARTVAAYRAGWADASMEAQDQLDAARADLRLASENTARWMADSHAGWGAYTEAVEDAVRERAARAAEIRELRAKIEEFGWAEMLTGQTCQNGKHADWFVDSEHNHLCPFCDRDDARARLDEILALLTDEEARTEHAEAEARRWMATAAGECDVTGEGGDLLNLARSANYRAAVAEAKLAAACAELNAFSGTPLPPEVLDGAAAMAVSRVTAPFVSRMCAILDHA